MKIKIPYIRFGKLLHMTEKFQTLYYNIYGSDVVEYLEHAVNMELEIFDFVQLQKLEITEKLSP